MNNHQHGGQMTPAGVDLSPLIARFEDVRLRLREEVSRAVAALEEMKARLDAGEVPTPLHMPAESLWAAYREARALGEAVELVSGR